MKIIFFNLLLLVVSSSFGRGIEVDTFLVKKEKEINTQLEIMRASKDDNVRYLENESLKELIESILVYPGVLDYPFESFKTMSTIISPDGAFRLFNWNIENNAGLNSHFCYMVLPSRVGKPNSVITFTEDNVTIPPRPSGVLTPLHWYGALYYTILPVKKGGKTLYTMIGYDGGGRSTNKKILDVFYFKGKKLKMGYPIFQESSQSKRLVRRVFFEYSDKVTIAVNMNEQLNAIVFDHLTPESPSLEGMYDYYVPDMTYDGYRWEGSAWMYKEDMIAVNGENRRISYYRPGEEGKEEKTVNVKDVWLNPVDGNPNGGGSNAVAPLEELEVDKKKKRSKRKKNRKKNGLFKRKKQKPHSAITG